MPYSVAEHPTSARPLVHRSSNTPDQNQPPRFPANPTLGRRDLKARIDLTRWQLKRSRASSVAVGFSSADDAELQTLAVEERRHIRRNHAVFVHGVQTPRRVLDQEHLLAETPHVMPDVAA